MQEIPLTACGGKVDIAFVRPLWLQSPSRSSFTTYQADNNPYTTDSCVATACSAPPALGHDHIAAAVLSSRKNSYCNLAVVPVRRLPPDHTLRFLYCLDIRYTPALRLVARLQPLELLLS